ncbi:uncharacterized protein [Leptinotarsa decemlineata]|uniref:uncharacterized protein n=1 Tax=Leptinotarsa decemlineata TaxID=7539 RepID=UPI003D30A18E
MHLHGLKLLTALIVILGNAIHPSSLDRNSTQQFFNEVADFDDVIELEKDSIVNFKESSRNHESGQSVVQRSDMFENPKVISSSRIKTDVQGVENGLSNSFNTYQISPSEESKENIPFQSQPQNQPEIIFETPVLYEVGDRSQRQGYFMVKQKQLEGIPHIHETPTHQNTQECGRVETVNSNLNHETSDDSEEIPQNINNCYDDNNSKNRNLHNLEHKHETLQDRADTADHEKVCNKLIQLFHEIPLVEQMMKEILKSNDPQAMNNNWKSIKCIIREQRPNIAKSDLLERPETKNCFQRYMRRRRRKRHSTYINLRNPRKKINNNLAKRNAKDDPRFRNIIDFIIKNKEFLDKYTYVPVVFATIRDSTYKEKESMTTSPESYTQPIIPSQLFGNATASSSTLSSQTGYVMTTQSGQSTQISTVTHKGPSVVIAQENPVISQQARNLTNELNFRIPKLKRTFQDIMEIMNSQPSVNRIKKEIATQPILFSNSAEKMSSLSPNIATRPNEPTIAYLNQSKLIVFPDIHMGQQSEKADSPEIQKIVNVLSIILPPQNNNNSIPNSPVPNPALSSISISSPDSTVETSVNSNTNSDFNSTPNSGLSSTSNSGINSTIKFTLNSQTFNHSSNLSSVSGLSSTSIYGLSSTATYNLSSILNSGINSIPNSTINLTQNGLKTFNESDMIPGVLIYPIADKNNKTKRNIFNLLDKDETAEHVTFGNDVLEEQMSLDSLDTIVNQKYFDLYPPPKLKKEANDCQNETEEMLNVLKSLNMRMPEDTDSSKKDLKDTLGSLPKLSNNLNEETIQSIETTEHTMETGPPNAPDAPDFSSLSSVNMTKLLEINPGEIGSGYGRTSFKKGKIDSYLNIGNSSNSTLNIEEWCATSLGIQKANDSVTDTISSVKEYPRPGHYKTPPSGMSTSEIISDIFSSSQGTTLSVNNIPKELSASAPSNSYNTSTVTTITTTFRQNSEVTTSKSSSTVKESIEASSNSAKLRDMTSKLKRLQKDLKLVNEVQNILNGINELEHRQKKRSLPFEDLSTYSTDKPIFELNFKLVSEIPDKEKEISGLGKILNWKSKTDQKTPGEKCRSKRRTRKRKRKRKRKHRPHSRNRRFLGQRSQNFQ